jgi:hypothetical protein
MELQKIARQAMHRQWAEDVKERQESKLSLRQWCKERGVPLTTYHYRLRILRKAFISGELPNHEAMFNEQKESQALELSTDDSSPIFAEIHPSKLTRGVQPAIVIRLGDSALEINNGADQETITNALQAWRRLC